MCELERAIKTIVEWAQSEQRIRKAYLFGSRLKGTENPKSDLDIAVEINREAGDINDYSAFAFDKCDYLQYLAEKIPFRLDLQLYAGEIETPKMYRYLSESSKVIYEQEI